MTTRLKSQDERADMNHPEVGVLLHDCKKLVLVQGDRSRVFPIKSVGGLLLFIQRSKCQQRRLLCRTESGIEHHLVVNQMLQDPHAEHIVGKLPDEADGRTLQGSCCSSIEAAPTYVRIETDRCKLRRLGNKIYQGFPDDTYHTILSYR